eukprot:COSAG02_NODE_8425_length_2575_cov_4.168821_2_plen_70_part_00
MGFVVAVAVRGTHPADRAGSAGGRGRERGEAAGRWPLAAGGGGERERGRCRQGPWATGPPGRRAAGPPG